MPAGALLERSDQNAAGSDGTTRHLKDAPQTIPQNVKQDGVREHRIVGTAKVFGVDVKHPGGVTGSPEQVDELDCTVGAIH